jgi:hypothetical protein
VAALEALDRVLPRGPGPAAGLPELSARGLDLAAFEGAEGPLWIEVSPRPEGFPAAAERRPQGGEGAWRLPDEIARRSGAGPWYLTVADDRGRELARGVLADGA